MAAVTILHRLFPAVPLLALALTPACHRRACVPAPEPIPGRPDYGRLTEMRPVPGNLISNGGFESGLLPWFSTSDIPPVLSTEVAHSGQNSLHALLHGQPGSRGQYKWGAFYEVGKIPFPKYLSLWYRVDGWQAANVPQYLMVMVAASNGALSYQIRYAFGGADKAPMNSDGNVHFIMARTELPPFGQWAHLSLDLAQDFQKEWRRIPLEFDALRFAVVVRYDAIREPLRAPVHADVYFDDVYVGWLPPPNES